MDFELKDFEMYNAVSRESEKYQSQIILRSNVLCHHFYLPKVIILVQTDLEYSAG